MNNGHRIVISGIGALSPSGVGRENYFAALAQGRYGIRTITQFDASELPCRIAGAIDSRPAQLVDNKNIRHISSVVPIAVAATDDALSDARPYPRAADRATRHSIGVRMASF